jgi:hypothetical protein
MVNGIKKILLTKSKKKKKKLKTFHVMYVTPMAQVRMVFYDINLVIQEFMVGRTCGLNSNLPMEHIQEFEVHALMSPTIGLHQ